MERCSINKLKSFVAVGLAGTALFACTERAEDQTSLSIVPVPTTDTYLKSLVVVHQPDMTSLERDWDTSLVNHSGEVDIAVYDFESGRTAHTHYPKQADGATFDTGSIVKLSLLEKLLHQSQSDNQPINEYEKTLATEMIENSDNDATDRLWNEVGGESAMNDYWHQLGTTSTTGGTDGFWGNTQTTALDQLKVVNAIARAGTDPSSLSVDSAAIAEELLQQVVPDQRWGVSGGLPNTVPVNVKNGWLPDACTMNVYSNASSWTINSIGYIPGEYSIAILTRGNPTMQDGITTAENLSAITWNGLQKPDSRS